MSDFALGVIVGLLVALAAVAVFVLAFGYGLEQGRKENKP
jgi:hypothetical protein